MAYTTETFIEKAQKKHGDKYDYSKVEYKDSLTKVTITCPTHGEFEQVPSAHLRGYGCPKCANKKRGDTFRFTKEEFVNNANIIHRNKYDYSKVDFVNYETKVTITCPIHGDFEQTPHLHLIQKSGCPKCKGRNLSQEEIIDKFKQVHGEKYYYDKTKYVKMHDKVIITCPTHGDFEQTPSKHILGQGCPLCAKEKRVMDNILTTEEFIAKAREIHGEKYDYSKVEYKGTYEKVTIICPKHGEFEQVANYHLNGHGCQHCGVIISKWEDEINEFINSLGVETVRNDRTVLGGGEIDIYIPSLSVGIECDGLIWHSSKFKNDEYHLNKTKECLKKGIKLIHIFEDEWMAKKEIVKSILKIKLFKLERKIYARNCEICEIDKETKKQFIITNHIQGDVPSLFNIGLKHNGMLVAIMTFGNLRKNLGNEKKEGEYELLRLCSSAEYVVVGGASKMLKYFIKTYKPIKIISYCDRRWSDGNVYEKMGMSLSHISRPNYYYLIGNNRKNRFSLRKDVLVGLGFCEEKSEREITEEKGIYRIYDCGSLVYELAF